MNIIGIETTTRLCSVAVVGAEIQPSERSELVHNRFSERLFALIDEVLAEARCRVRSLRGVAVSIGPGSYTGTRVGISVAKGVAHSLDIPLIGVTVYEAMSRIVDTACFPLCCVVPIKGEKIAFLLAENKEAQNLRTPGIAVTWQELAPYLEDAVCVCGDIPKERQEIIRRLLPDSCRFVAYTPSGAAVARIGLQRLEREAGDDPVTLAPIYMHEIVFRERFPRGAGT